MNRKTPHSPVCKKSYTTIEDLSTHMVLRHPGAFAVGRNDCRLFLCGGALVRRAGAAARGSDQPAQSLHSGSERAASDRYADVVVKNLSPRRVCSAANGTSWIAISRQANQSRCRFCSAYASFVERSCTCKSATAAATLAACRVRSVRPVRCVVGIVVGELTHRGTRRQFGRRAA